MPTEPANQEQRTFWNEQAGPRWVRLQQRLDAQIYPLGTVAMQRAATRTGERVLDVGCGCGQTTLELAQQVGPQGSVVGVDLSRPMLERARERQRERNLTNVQFMHADAQTYAFTPSHFDVAFSRFGVMFFEDPLAAFTNIRAALRSQGRLCFVCWQGLDKNDWATVPLAAALQHLPPPPRPAPGTPGPFAFADHIRVRQILEGAGFTAVQFEPHEQQLSMGGASTVDEAVAFTLEIGPVATLLRDATADIQEKVRQSLTDALRPYVKNDGVQLGGAVWIVQARSPD